MNKRNYQKEMEEIISSGSGFDYVPSLLLHSCCAPCSSYVLQYLSSYFRITVYYCNPNIHPSEEYYFRAEEQRVLIERMEVKHAVQFVAGEYRPEEFYQAVKGLEQEPEGGSRCMVCYELRLRFAALMAAEGGYDYYTTTLSISPLKQAEKLNEIGERLGREFHVAYLPSDFKKKDGYKHSVRLSEEYGLYRQNYCGCVYSMPPANQREGGHITNRENNDRQPGSLT